MKYLPHLLLATATALSLASCAAPGGGGAAAESQLGPHSAQKFVLATRLGARPLNESDPNYVRTVALVLTVEQTMKGNQQDITAKVSAHRDGPHGSLQDARGIQVRIVQPVQSASKVRNEPGAGEINVSNSVSAPGGKYRTVVAEATMNNPDYTPQTVSLTIPGDQ